jgi:hypothetical protein
MSSKLYIYHYEYQGQYDNNKIVGKVKSRTSDLTTHRVFAHVFKDTVRIHNSPEDLRFHITQVNEIEQELPEVKVASLPDASSLSTDAVSKPNRPPPSFSHSSSISSSSKQISPQQDMASNSGSSSSSSVSSSSSSRQPMRFGDQAQSSLTDTAAALARALTIQTQSLAFSSGKEVKEPQADLQLISNPNESQDSPRSTSSLRSSNKRRGVSVLPSSNKNSSNKKDSDDAIVAIDPYVAFTTSQMKSTYLYKFKGLLSTFNSTNESLTKLRVHHEAKTLPKFLIPNLAPQFKKSIVGKDVPQFSETVDTIKETLNSAHLHILGLIIQQKVNELALVKGCLDSFVTETRTAIFADATKAGLKISEVSKVQSQQIILDFVESAHSKSEYNKLNRVVKSNIDKENNKVILESEMKSNDVDDNQSQLRTLIAAEIKKAMLSSNSGNNSSNSSNNKPQNNNRGRSPNQPKNAQDKTNKHRKKKKQSNQSSPRKVSFQDKKDYNQSKRSQDSHQNQRQPRNRSQNPRNRTTSYRRQNYNNNNDDHQDQQDHYESRSRSRSQSQTKRRQKDTRKEKGNRNHSTPTQSRSPNRSGSWKPKRSTNNRRH